MVVPDVPFRSGHLLALRRFPVSSIGPAYTSVWHRRPDGQWTFYATIDPLRACNRYFGSAVAETAVADIQLRWTGARRLAVAVGEDLIRWEIVLAPTAMTRTLSALIPRLPARLWRQPPVLRLLGAVAGPALRVGRLRLHGTVPNGQRLMMKPRLVWAVPESTATWQGADLGPVGALPEQAQLGDVWLPQRGLFMVGAALFEPFDPVRHRAIAGATGS